MKIFIPVFAGWNYRSQVPVAVSTDLTGLIIVFSFTFMIRMFGGIDGLITRYNNLYYAMQSNDPEKLMEAYNQLYGGL